MLFLTLLLGYSIVLLLIDSLCVLCPYSDCALFKDKGHLWCFLHWTDPGGWAVTLFTEPFTARHVLGDTECVPALADKSLSVVLSLWPDSD